ncbi:uncharacterized protein LOC113507333 [Trichoplusia ni]|uniref:Uncharacterized protein LOC113507333 n=1 Tax=Trichoplusia ni TaxID=7111 RepID=A0A7E5X018_TRINI|nr:uncharacterized protein LOC113507333 [Trichoplusia ni]
MQAERSLFTIYYITMVQVTLSTISKYLTEEVIDKAFKLRTNSDDSVQSIAISRAAPAGEGLISAVYRIQVNGKIHTATFIIKGIVRDPLLRKSITCDTYSKREVYFFSTILPILRKTQMISGAKENIQDIIPLCYGQYSDGSDDYILLADLAEAGFVSISELPTISEMNLTLKALAHFHAVSFALRIKNPDIFEEIAMELNELYYNEEKRNWYAKYFQNAIEINKSVLSEFESPESIYCQKYFSLVDGDAYGELMRVVSCRGEHPVFNHGDAWCCNFLCTKERAVVIDFQIMRCASPVTDLAYFIIMCSNVCQTKEEFLDAVILYYSSLKYYLGDMGIDASEAFSFDMLMEELKKYGKFGILAAITSLPLVASKRCDTLESFETLYSDLDSIPLEVLWELTPIKNEEHKKRIVNAIRISVDVGLI